MNAERASWRPEQPAETAYQKARQEWDLRMGNQTVHAANWRRAAFALMGLLLVSLLGDVYLGTLPKFVPHIIEVDKLGEPKYLGPLEREALRDFRPTTPSIQYHLRRFVSDTREIPADAALLKRNWIDAYKLVTQNGANELNAWVHDSNPFAQLENQVRITLEVNVVVAINADTWQADWTETTWDEHRNVIDSSAWRGTFRILLRVPASTDELAVNPLGLYIDELHWARLSSSTPTERTLP